MSANNIAETIADASSGTGNLTLSGALVNADQYLYGETFHSFYGVNHVFEYEIRDKLGNREYGEGYLSNSTTLVRLNVFDNSLKTTAKINFPAGPGKIVYVPTTARAFGARMLNKVTYSLTGQAVGVRGSMALAANTLYVCPHLIAAPCRLSTIAFRVTAQSAGAEMRVGIYNLTKQSDTGNDYDSVFPLFVDLGTVNVGTTGIKPIACDIKLAQGVYGFAVISNGTPQLMACGTNLVWTGAPGNTYENNQVSFWSAGNAAFFAALPANTPNAMSAIMNVGAPQAMLRGGIQ